MPNNSNKESDEISESFDEIEGFIEEGEEDLKLKEEFIEDELEDEKKEIASLEEKKEGIEQKKKEVEEKIRNEKANVEHLKEEERFIKSAEKKAEQIKEEVKEKGKSIASSVGKIGGIFKNEGISHESKNKKGIIRHIYEDHYKKLLIIPFVLLLLAVFQISYQYGTTGDFVNRGVDLKGGITLTMPEQSYDIAELQQFLKKELSGDASVRSISQTKGILIEASDVSEEDLLAKVEELLGPLAADEYSVESMGSSLGSSFFSEVMKAIAIAFILMGIVVYITFRVPAPTLAVILAVFSDIVITLAIFNLTGMKLGKGGIAAFLMLIGYSVDTDILLSTKVLKRKFGTVMDRVYSSIKTGMTMSITTIVAIIVAMIFTDSEVIRQITLIIFIGLLVDMINTWIQNVGIIRMYVEKKGLPK